MNSQMKFIVPDSPVRFDRLDRSLSDIVLDPHFEEDLPTTQPTQRPKAVRLDLWQKESDTGHWARTKRVLDILILMISWDDEDEPPSR
jgi:hypothetical protein